MDRSARCPESDESPSFMLSPPHWLGSWPKPLFPATLDLSPSLHDARSNQPRMRTRHPGGPDEPLHLARGIRRDTLRRRHLARSMSAVQPPATPRQPGSSERHGLGPDLPRDRSLCPCLRKFGEEVFLLTDGRGWDAGMIGTACLGGDSGSLGGHALELGRPLVVEDLRYFPRFRAEPVLVDTGTKGDNAHRGQRPGRRLRPARGVQRQPAVFSPDEAEFLTGLADGIAAAQYREDWRRHLAGRHPHRRAGRPGKLPR